MKKSLTLFILLVIASNSAQAGLSIVKSNGIAVTGADGINYIGASGIAVTGADSFLTYRSNGIVVTGADGIPVTGVDGLTSTGANGGTYTGPNGIAVTGADGIAVTGADGIVVTGADGIVVTGADGTQYRADSILIHHPNGIAVTGADGITVTGVDSFSATNPTGISKTGSNGITVTGADAIAMAKANGITVTGVDGIAVTGADSVVGFRPDGVVFDKAFPQGITVTGADSIVVTGVDGITVNRPQGLALTGIDGITVTGADGYGLQSVDPELAIALNNATDDSSVNAVIVYHGQVTDADIGQLQQAGILGGTRMRVLPMVYVTATKSQIIAVSHLPSVRSIYGNRTLTFNSDPYFNATGIQRVGSDSDLRAANNFLPVTGRNITVAVLDTGINALHPDLAGKVVQNVRLADLQSVPTGFSYPIPTENLVNTDLAGGHGTFVAGVVSASGASSNGKYAGVASGSRLLGLSAGDANLIHVLSGYDYLLEKGANYGVKVVNCSFSANTVYDVNDPVNIATKMLTDRGVNVVFSAGNTGSGNGTLNPYAVAPWVIGVGASDRLSHLAAFSSRGNFGDSLQHPSLIAPGVDVVSLRNVGTETGTTGLGGADTQRLSLTELPSYTTGSGTSFSAPQVAGAIALMLEANPNLSPAEIKDILSRTATPLPKYFYHEAGAGMLNTYAAVLDAAFANRNIGTFRSTLSRNTVKFTTTSGQDFLQMVFPSAATNVSFNIPANTVQASVDVAWGLSANDFGLKVYNSSNSLLGESNKLNLLGIGGLRENVVLRNPASQTVHASIQQTAGIGTAQNVFGSMEVTQVIFPDLLDLSTLDPALLLTAQNSLLTSVMLPQGMKYRPNSTVPRVEFAEAMVRAGFVPQYVAAAPLFTDVHDAYSRNVIESVQANPAGKFIYDATAGNRFYPNSNTTKLVAAVAFVKAAGLESSAATAALPPTVTDALSIPSNLRGYVAIALQQGFVTLDGSAFNSSRAITRIELARAMNIIVNN